MYSSTLIHGLVNNAGVGLFVDTVDTTKAQLQEVFSVNVYGAIFLTQAVVPHIRKGGRIVNVSSVAAKLGFESAPIYSASKAALDSLSFSWAQEFGRKKAITVNSIAPGPVSTDIVPPEIDFDALSASMIAMTRADNRVGTVADISDAVLLVVSEKGRWITGQHISASGGMTGQ
jgi:NAD(P)-dependent dehydrogenase (short-subunit alcohol dehydrogenase family)